MSTTTRTENRPVLGYFLTYEVWQDAIALLEFQLSQKPVNKHFNTLSMFYYERLSTRDKNRLQKQTYFEQRVANNLLYALETEFTIHAYPIPKSSLGLREYRFFTYPMRIAYYAIGLYFFRLSQELVQEYYRTNKAIDSEYGGRLTVDSGTGRLTLKHYNIWYKPHYRRFRARVRRETKGDISDKVIIHIDIQNYFEEIQIARFLEFLTEYVKPSIQRELRFDAITHSQIRAFFDHVSSGTGGIPQTDNDIISSYLGYLYMIFGDMLIEQVILKYSDSLKKHAVIRYMDDIYVSLEFEPAVRIHQREIAISALASRIADILYQELGLRLNTKTRLFWLRKPDEVDALLRNLKKVSPGHELPDDDARTSPQEKLTLIFDQLRRLKRSSLDPSFNERSDVDEEILKEIYDKNVLNLLGMPDVKRQIHNVFSDFNFDLVIAQPREILIILLADHATRERFEKFLLNKSDLTSRDVQLILTFLCQTEFASRKLINLLLETESMANVMDVFQHRRIPTSQPGYFDLRDSQVLKLVQYPNVIEQIRLRIQAEQRHDYSVALNHLLNEIHAICHGEDSRGIDEKHYSANHVIEFLQARTVPHETCIKIRNLFDRRNKNPVSHADPIAWPVSRDEYLGYYEQVGRCAMHLL